MSSKYRFIYSVLLFAVINASCSLVFTGSSPMSQAGLENENTHHKEFGPHPGYNESVNKGIRTEDGRPGEAYWQQYTSYRLDVTLDPDRHLLSGIAHITYHNQSPDTLHQLELELVQNLHKEGAPRKTAVETTGGVRLHQIKVNDEILEENPPERPGYVVEYTRMIIYPSSPLKPGEKSVIEIKYDFEIPHRGAGGRMGRSRDNLYFLGYWYPHMVVYDDIVGWHPEPFLGMAEFFHGFADYALTIRAPEEWLIMATGELLNAEEVLHPDVLHRWKQAKKSDETVRVYSADSGEQATNLPGRRGRHSEPEPVNARSESVSISSASPPIPNKSLQKGDDSLLSWHFTAEQVRDVAFSAVRNSNWDAARVATGTPAAGEEAQFTAINTFWRNDAPLWSKVNKYQQHAITFFSDLTGYPYPWPHMTAVEGNGIIGGGMEYPMMTVMGDYNYLGEESLYTVTAHEIGHIWIPLIVSTDERRYGWFDEGITVFATSEAVADYYPDKQPHLETFEQYLRIVQNSDEAPVMLHSDSHKTYSQYIHASYAKPAAGLRALEKILGTEVFWRAYREFIEDWAFRQAYPWDFFRTFERVSGRSLDWFWNGWFYETWVLDHAIKKVKSTGKETLLTIHNKGDMPMPVFLTVTLENGSTLKEVIPETVWLDGKQKTEWLLPQNDVIKIEIDVGHMLPYINRKNTIWRRPS